MRITNYIVNYTIKDDKAINGVSIVASERYVRIKDMVIGILSYYMAKGKGMKIKDWVIERIQIDIAEVKSSE